MSNTKTIMKGVVKDELEGDEKPTIYYYEVSIFDYFLIVRYTFLSLYLKLFSL